MSKSKSRQPSRQASAASKSVSSGGARAAATASKATTKAAVEDALESTVKDEPTSTTVEVTTNKGTSELANDVEATSKTTDEVKGTGKLTDDAKATSKSVDDDAKKASVAKTVKAASTVPATSGKGAVAKAPAKAVPNTPALRPIPTTPVNASSKAQSRDAVKYERRQQERQQRYLAERRRRRNRIITTISVILALAIIGGGIYYAVRQYNSGGNSKAAQGSYQEAIYNTSYPPVDSVYCDQLEGSIEHIHAFVAIYIDGQQSAVPQYLGIPQDSSGNATCYYWLHTHDTTGIIHIESPVDEIFTFGQLRDEWDQQFVSLGFPPELLLTNGWTIWVNGKIYTGSLASAPLAAHNIITLAYNSPKVKPVTTYNWGSL